ncbi:MAG: 2-C-methyl-D-erythritol 4-phosphate cytidylyltransferase [Nitriliruptoraceae bacterium]
MNVGVIIVAAGRGTRMSAPRPKALIDVGGRAMVTWAADHLAAAGLPAPVVVHSPGERGAFADALTGHEVHLVVGGSTRSDSVRRGLAALDADIVVVHDAARPFMPPEVIQRALAAVGGDVIAAAPAVAVADTLKRRAGDDLVGTVARDDLVAVQTPQVFIRAALDTALAAGASATDELTLVEGAIAAGELTGRIRFVAGSVFGHKVTTEDDFALLDTIASASLQGFGA